MRSPRSVPRCLAVTLVALGFPSDALAQLFVVTSPGPSPALAYAEVAFAEGEGEPVSWLSLRLRRGPVAIVAALPGRTSCEPTVDAWFTALERTASPNVLLPAGATDCGKIASFSHVSWPRSPGVGAEELTLTTPEDVAAALDERGLGAELPLPEAPRYAVWTWPVETGEETTRTLRITGPSAPLSFVPASDWPVLVSHLSSGPRAWPGEALLDQLGVTFVAGKPSSDYVAQLQGWLQAERAPLLEARSTTAIFGWSILADTVSLPPLVRSYARVAADERADVDFERCARQLQAASRGDAVSADDCGSATDAALALAAAGPRPALQRWVLSGLAPLDVAALRDGGQPSAPLLRARAVDESACPEVVVVPPIVLPPSPSASGGTTGRGESPTAVEPEPEVTTAGPCQSDGCSSCGPARDPYYDDRRTTVYCGGDTSSSSGDDSCSSDTSSSSGDDSCSSDTSSSSGDDSCSSSDQSYDGDTCTGRAAPGAEPKAAQAALSGARAGRPQRLRLSLWSLALAAVLLPIRRRKRASAM